MSNKEVFEEEVDEVIILKSADGEEIEFEDVASINYEDKFYKILAPVTPVEGMQDDEALVFEVVAVDDENDQFNIVLDEDVIEGVFAIYNQLLEETED
ncbi:MAG: DUF1292 domain-containing protein [Clostridiales bacterium]|nr:DUF1292 domain-containing protein [Clostridiales bacterium]